MITVPYMLDSGAFIPSRAHNADAGFDIRIPCDALIKAKNALVINTGVHMLIPDGYVGFLKSKSGLNVRFGLNGEGVIDAGYTGSIVVKMYNHSYEDYYFSAGDKLIQLVVLPIPEVNLKEVDSFESTDRGNNGFGSTGK